MSTCGSKPPANNLKKHLHMVRKVPMVKRATQAQVIVSPEAKDSSIVFRIKLRLRPGGELEKLLFAQRAENTGLNAKSLCGPFLRVGGHV